MLEKSCRIVTVDEMQFGFMPERGTIDAVLILRRMHEEHHAKGKKLYMCCVDLEIAFDRVPRRLFAKSETGQYFHSNLKSTLNA